MPTSIAEQLMKPSWPSQILQALIVQTLSHMHPHAKRSNTPTSNSGNSKLDHGRVKTPTGVVFGQASDHSEEVFAS